MSLTEYFIEGVVTGTVVMVFVLLIEIVYNYVQEKT